MFRKTFWVVGVKMSARGQQITTFPYYTVYDKVYKRPIYQLVSIKVLFIDDCDFSTFLFAILSLNLKVKVHYISFDKHL